MDEWLSDDGGSGEWGVIANRYAVSFCNVENFLDLDCMEQHLLFQSLFLGLFHPIFLI